MTSELTPSRNWTATESRAIELLGQGLSAEVVAAAVGVTPGRISQLLSEQSFSDTVSELRYKNLSEQTSKDKKYDALESSLLNKMEESLPMMFKPMEILKAIQVINAAKRRGSIAPESLQQKSETVNLIMPTQILQHFTTNINNQVIKAGDQDLVTVQSGNMNKMLEDSKSRKEQNHVLPPIFENVPVSRASN